MTLQKRKNCISDNKPQVSCLCVTENRSAFLPWLLWCFDRQQWPNKELVIIDSSKKPYHVTDRDNVRVIPVQPGTGVAIKRNLALKEAQGKIISWFDDDDWQHPKKLVWLVEALDNGVPYAGSIQGWFVDLRNARCMIYRTTSRQIIFNSAGFRKDVLRSSPFSENMRVASDTQWLRSLYQRYRNQAVILEREVLFFWLCHQYNISNPARRRRFNQPLKTLKDLIGDDAWGDTDEALEDLRERLAQLHQKPTAGLHRRPVPAVSKKSKLHTETAKAPEIDKKSRQNESEPPPVSLMIKATVMDVPYLNTMVEHMISQARCDFAERVIVVDRNPSFSGKYARRFKTSNKELDDILSKFTEGRVVDRIIDVDYRPDRIRDISERYFGNDYRSIPTHAATGGPIYTTLFGLEKMKNDYVLQMDADVFFFTAGASWVKESLRTMAHDERLWLMMTHPGPPDGPIGASLGRRNAGLAKWDRDFEIWRFQTATTRYFLCNRQKLHGRLLPAKKATGIAPLEQMIGHALKRHGAYRGALGNLDSWHLHAWYHDKPFPQWAALLAKAIESGKYPPLQRGFYDLRLDLDRDRREWRKALQPFLEKKPVFTGVAGNDIYPSDQRTQRKVKQPHVVSNNSPPIHQVKNSADVKLSGLEEKEKVHEMIPVDRSPLAAVIPIRNRAGRRLKNTIAGLQWQSAGPPVQLLIVSHGSESETDKELSKICSGNGCSLITIGKPKDPWNKPFALNVGIRATKREVPFVMTMDVDMILAPNFLAVVLEKLRMNKSALILCRSSDLPSNVSLPSDGETLKKEYANLKRQSSLRPHWGPGGIQAAKRSFFFSIRGYDEDLRWWGAMDIDMVQRAQLAGRAVEWIEDRTTMLHQWHPRKHRTLTCPDKIKQAKLAWQSNHVLVQSRSKKLQRNPTDWGGGMN